jgi:antitoxin FitA
LPRKQFAAKPPNFAAARGILTRWVPCEITEIIEINGLMDRPMPGNLHVRNLDDDLIARLKRRAARHGRSTEAEHREILRQALFGDVEPSFDTLAADLRKMTKRRKQTPSEILLREGREER